MADSVPHAAPDGAGPARPDVLAALVEDLGGRYSFRLDGRDPHRAFRYIAVARSLDVRPHAVDTSSLAELRVALSGNVLLNPPAPAGKANRSGKQRHLRNSSFTGEIRSPRGAHR